MTSRAVHLVSEGLRSPADAVRRFTRICAGAGIGSSTGGLAAVSREAARVGPGEVFVLSFSGHAARSAPSGWELPGGTLTHRDVAGMLAEVSVEAGVVVVADTCYAAQFAEVLPFVPATTVLLAACGVDQSTLDFPISQFAVSLEANAGAPTYAALRDALRRDTPDAERPEVHVNHPRAWTCRPFRAR